MFNMNLNKFPKFINQKWNQNNDPIYDMNFDFINWFISWTWIQLGLSKLVSLFSKNF
jgi:hypothetical protein